MRLLAAFLLAGAVGLLPAQTPNLEVRLQAGNLVKGLPQEFTIQLVNISDRDVRLPPPMLECQDARRGVVELYLSVTPGSNRRMGGCADDFTDAPPTIAEQAKAWKTLHAGEALTLKAERQSLRYKDSEPGKYEYWALYTPPALTVVEKKTLHEMGIDFADSRLESKHVTFEREK